MEPDNQSFQEDSNALRLYSSNRSGSHLQPEESSRLTDDRGKEQLNLSVVSANSGNPG